MTTIQCPQCQHVILLDSSRSDQAIERAFRVAFALLESNATSRLSQYGVPMHSELHIEWQTRVQFDADNADPRFSGMTYADNPDAIVYGDPFRVERAENLVFHSMHEEPVADLRPRRSGLDGYLPFARIDRNMAFWRIYHHPLWRTNKSADNLTPCEVYRDETWEHQIEVGHPILRGILAQMFEECIEWREKEYGPERVRDELRGCVPSVLLIQRVPVTQVRGGPFVISFVVGLRAVK